MLDNGGRLDVTAHDAIACRAVERRVLIIEKFEDNFPLTKRG
jgi:hypothetical protein